MIVLSTLPSRRWRYLGEWLFLLAGLLILGGFIAYSQYQERTQIDSNERERLTSQAALIETNLVPQMFSTRRAIDSILASLPAWHLERNSAQLANQQLHLLADTMSGIGALLVINADGLVLASNKEELIGQNLSYRDYFQAALKNADLKTLYLTPPFKTVLNTFVMSFYRVIPGPAGEFGGIVIASVDPKYFGTLLDSVRYTADSRSFLIHGDGKLFMVAPSRPDLNGKDLAKPDSLFTRHRNSGQAGSVFAETAYVTNEERLAAFRTIQPADLLIDKPLVVVVSRDLQSVFADWKRECLIQDSMFGAFALISILGLFLYQWRQKVFDRLSDAQQQALRASETRLHSFVDASPDGLLISDEQGMISMTNQQVERLLGYTMDELVGQSIEILVPDRSRANHPGLRALFAASPSARRMGQGLSVSARRKDGSECDVEISLGRIETGQGLFFACSLRDSTERKHAEVALRASMESLNEAQRLAHIGSWTLNLTTEELSCSDEVFRLFELDPNQFSATYQAFLDAIHPGDRDAVNKAYTNSLVTRTPFEIIHRLLMPDGRIKWVQEKCLSDFDAAGTAIRSSGTVQDITDRQQADIALSESEQRFRALTRMSSDFFWETDVEHRITARTESQREAAEEVFLKASPIGKRRWEIPYLSPDESGWRQHQALLDAYLPFRGFEFSRPRSNGTVHHISLSGDPVFDVFGQFTGYHGVGADITETRKHDEQLRIAATAFESQEGSIVTDADGVIVRVNRAFTEGTGYTEADLLGKNPRLLQSGRHNKDFFCAMWETIRQTGRWQGEIWDRRKNGEIYPKWLTISAVKNDDGAVTHYVGTHADISAHKQAEERIHELAFFDQLTGLPNRTLLLDRLKQTMTSSSRSGNYGALLFIDLDNFKELNDTAGHEVGDLLLKQVAQRLKQCVREGDSVARFGGDEFVVVLANLGKSEMDAANGTETVAEKILATLNQIYRFSDVAHRSSASIGATLFNGHPISIDNLMKQADLSMYKAKEAGRNALRFFDPAMEVAVKARTALEADLRQAIEAKRLVLHYQAQVAGGRVTGAEVLVRWKHAKRGMVSPAEFIPLAEETGLILPLGHWVVETACTQLAIWATQPAMAHFTLAVNVSAVQFRQADFVDQVLSVLDSVGANPRRLKLELTESMLADNVQDMIEKMFALKARGVGFSLDDFGTGYSSLSYLKRLPLDQLKIDQSFVRDVMVDANDAAIARTIVALAQSLGLGVIAEGVETEAQRDFLAGVGCHAYQGYFFSRPLAVEAFECFAQDMMCPA